MGDVLAGTCSWTDRALLASGRYTRGHRDPGPRLRYAYSESELTAWAPRLRAAAKQVDELHVLFHNCCADAAVRAAETMRRILAGR
ncbi:DUF72 domain-containing protein [Streptomyces sp. NBC_00487]|uniref:DUF72 domain-containing protein n=1 Tax=unclassified Streptomyces TaxID=2593676 RepID=UPI002E17CE90|nr:MULTISPECIES: DUF72 domain-containing protein [unclassified Streptomyces]